MSGADTARLVAMSEQHFDATWTWLACSETLRAQVDCLDPPTREGNIVYWREKLGAVGREDYAVLDADDRHVGNCGLCNIDLRRRKAELWIYLGERHGQGIGTAATRCLLARAFRELGLNRVFLRVVLDNAQARKFYLRLGFTEEGRWRQDTLLHGRFTDSAWFSMLAEEYAVLPKTAESGP